MDKIEAIDNFLRSLKIALTSASIYFKEHPLFIKSLEDLRISIDGVFDFLDVIKIGVAVNYLFIEDTSFDKSIAYQELASVFHRRKIKNIIITKGVTLDELSIFILNVSLPVKDLIIRGGIKNILDKEGFRHIEVIELDYSQLLIQEGSPNNEAWAYLLEEAIEENNLQKIGDFADNFQQIIKNIRPQDFIKNQELKESMQNFLNFLKAKEEEKFKKCSKEILKVILKDKNISSEEDLKEFNVFLKDMDESDLVDSLWDEISTDGSFDALSFSLFFKLIDEKKHSRISSIIVDKQNKGLLKINPEIKKKIKELFSVPKSEIFEDIYRHAFDFLLKDISFEDKGFSFNSENLLTNYLFVLLNIFSCEKDKGEINLVKDRIISQWDMIKGSNDYKYLRYLLEISLKRKNESDNLKDAFLEIQRYVTNTIETVALSGGDILDYSYFVENLDSLTLDSYIYLDKIFKEKIASPIILSLFFKFYPEDFSLFCNGLEKISSDIEFSIKIIEAIKKVDSQLSLASLKNIFSFSNNFVKIEILRAMQELKNIDQEFLFSILSKEGPFLRKEALLILDKHSLLNKAVLDILLNIRDVFGKNNRLLIENMIIVDELKLKSAREYLVRISKRPFFWNNSLRKKAKEILKKLLYV